MIFVGCNESALHSGRLVRFSLGYLEHHTKYARRRSTGWWHGVLLRRLTCWHHHARHAARGAKQATRLGIAVHFAARRAQQGLLLASCLLAAREGQSGHRSNSRELGGPQRATTCQKSVQKERKTKHRKSDRQITTPIDSIVVTLG